MNKQTDILDKISRRDGFKMPSDAYFDDFAKRMDSALEPRPELESARRREPMNFWRRVRPYVYMAAMFAGIWCMLKVFTLMTNNSDANGLSIEASPALANAAQNEQFVEDYIIDDVSNWDLYNYMVEDSIEFYNIMDSTYNASPEAVMPL